MKRHRHPRAVEVLQRETMSTTLSLQPRPLTLPSFSKAKSWTSHFNGNAILRVETLTAKLRRITLDHSAQSATWGIVDRAASSTRTLWKSLNDGGIPPTGCMWWQQREIWVSSRKQSLHPRAHSCTAVSTTSDLYPRTREKVYRSFYMLQDLCHPPRNGFQFLDRCLSRYVQAVYWTMGTLCYACKWLRN